MPDYWGALPKSLTDAELIEAAINRIFDSRSYVLFVATWSSVPKSQTDDSTIDEEIALLISNHEADPDAHLEVGESLQSHKASEIIDHIAGSVVRDKLGFDRFSIDSHFESIDSWTKSGNCYLQGINALIVQTLATTNAFSYIEIYEQDNQQDQTAYANEPNFQITVYFETITNQLAYIGPMTEGQDNGFGFKAVNGDLYAVYFDDDQIEQATFLQTIASGSLITLRCRFDPATHTHYWYVNGGEVLTAVYNHTMGYGMFACFFLKTTNNSLKRIWMSNFHYDAIQTQY